MYEVTGGSFVEGVRCEDVESECQSLSMIEDQVREVSCEGEIVRPRLVVCAKIHLGVHVTIGWLWAHLLYPQADTC
jgi:hypothetical protein